MTNGDRPQERTMRIGVDAMGWMNRRGYGRFARNAIARLVERDVERTYHLYVDAQTATDATLPTAAELRVVSLRRMPLEGASAGSSRPIRDLLTLTAAVRRDRLHAFLFPSLQTYFPVLGTPTVVGLHDAIPEELPELTIGSRRSRSFWHAKQAIAIWRAARLFTVSESAREALATRLGIAAERLAIVPEAPAPVFSPRSSESILRAREAIGLELDEPYYLYAGGISPHKGVETLIAAFASLREGRLVIVGDLESETYLSAAASVRAAIAAHELHRQVLLPGYVDDESLAALYSGATAVVIPSLAEGFGLPAVEAAACGAPLVLSNIPAHRETLDGAAYYFPPGDVDALARRMGDVLRGPSDLGERARRAVEGRTWDAAAESLRAIVEDVVERRGRRIQSGATAPPADPQPLPR